MPANRFMTCIIHSLVIGAMFGVSGCGFGGPRVKGSGVARTETREVGGFTRVESAGSANVTIQIGGTQSVVIETDDNILPLIETSVKGDRLVIGSHGSYSTRIGVKVTITVPALDEARISGSGNITVSGVAAKEFEAHISGSGDIRISGSSDSLKASIAGSGGIDATKLPVTAADASVTGSGNIKVVATQSLHARIAGSGDVRYGGNPPEIHKQVTGSGSVRSM
jgi:hypothetical protein